MSAAPARRAAVVLPLLLVVALLGIALPGIARGEAMWTTYHRDLGRSGYDPEAGEPVTPQLAWQSPELDGGTWGQPLVLGERVYVATAGDSVYALEASTGKVIWQKSAGTPVPAVVLPCGDVEPTVGIVGTPVIDTATDAIYAVADVWDAEKFEAKHVLKGYRLSDGEEILSTPVDPPGANPKTLLQRTALTLDAGDVVFGMGGNSGDCGEYRGTVVAAPENGEDPHFWQYQPKVPAFAGGAVWGPSGPVVAGEGDIYVATGNPNQPEHEEATLFDYSDSFLRLDPAVDLVAKPSEEPAPLGWFEPPTWKADSNADGDLGSAGPELLPEGILFQAGKNGTGYLLETDLTGAGSAVYEAQVCKGAKSFGGDAFADEVIYVGCSNGVQALSYDRSKRTFAPIWQGPSNAFGPPIVAAGTVWSVATRAFEGGSGTTLYGLAPATGEPRYNVTLPSGVTDHFASPSAAGGRLFVATGASVTAYTIAKPPSAEEPDSGGKGGEKSGGAGPPTPGDTTNPTPLPASPSSSTPLLLHTSLHASRAGNIRLTLRCPAQAARCKGTLTLRAEIPVRSGSNDDRGLKRLVSVTLVHVHYGPSAGEFEVVVRLGRKAEAHLRRHHYRLALDVEISCSGSAPRSVAAVLT